MVRLLSGYPLMNLRTIYQRSCQYGDIVLLTPTVARFGSKTAPYSIVLGLLSAARGTKACVCGTVRSHFREPDCADDLMTRHRSHRTCLFNYLTASRSTSQRYRH